MFLFRLLLEAAFTFFLSFTLDVFLEPFAGLPLEFVHFLDVIFKFFEVVEMPSQSELLLRIRVTSSAASRCYALIVFLLFCSQISLDLSASRVMNSGLGRDTFRKLKQTSDEFRV
jgi:hypothetical protein